MIQVVWFNKMGIERDITHLLLKLSGILLLFYLHFKSLKGEVCACDWGQPSSKRRNIFPCNILHVFIIPFSYWHEDIDAFYPLKYFLETCWFNFVRFSWVGSVVYSCRITLLQLYHGCWIWLHTYKCVISRFSWKCPTKLIDFVNHFRREVCQLIQHGLRMTARG